MIKFKTLIESIDGFSKLIEDTHLKYPIASDTVDGRDVGEKVSNTSSIGASLSNYKVLRGIREVPMSDFSDPNRMFYNVRDFDISKRLANMIDESNMITPLIIVVDSKGPYILEGAHRYVSLSYLKAKSFPAMVVVTDDDMNDETDDE